MKDRNDTELIAEAPEKRRLPRTLSYAEGWGFGVAGLLLWILAAGDCVAAIGTLNALLVWIPATAIGIVGNLQVKRLAERWPEMSGGTPNYAVRLLADRPWLARYCAMAYFQGWASVPTLSGILLSDVIVAYLAKWGIAMPAMPLYVVLTALAFSVAFSGTRTLGMLVVFFAVPALALLLLFVVTGAGSALWSASALAAGAQAPWSLPAWAKWYFICTYAAYSCETASSFIADSREPRRAIDILSRVTWLMPVVFVGGSAVMAHALPAEAIVRDTPVLNLVAAMRTLWGDAAWLLGSFLIAASALLSCATGAGNSPRVLYQLALDGHAAPLYGVASQRAVPGPALVMTVAVALGFLAWQGYAAVFVVTGTGWFLSFILLRLGIWRNRREAHACWPWLAAALAVVETAIFLVGGFAWGTGLFAAGLLLPAALVAVDRWIARGRAAWLRPAWWIERYAGKPSARESEIVATIPAQFIALLALVLAACAATWLIGVRQLGLQDTPGMAVFGAVILIVGFLVVSFLGWTLLPHLEHLGELNESLAAEIAERQHAQSKLREANESLERRSRELERSLAHLERRHREGKLLSELAGLLQVCVSAEEGGAIISRFCPQAFPEGPGALYLFSASRNYLERIAAWGEPAPAVMFAPAECWALRRGRAHRAHDGQITLPCAHARPDAPAALCIPLFAQGESLGVLHLEAGAGEDSFTRLLAEQLSLALANLKLRDALHGESPPHRRDGVAVGASDS